VEEVKPGMNWKKLLESISESVNDHPRLRNEYLVVLGRNNPSPYTVNGRPLYVHLNGLAIVLLK
jgi:hypothetical protein